MNESKVMAVFSHGLKAGVKPPGKPARPAKVYPVQMDVFEIRKRNLAALVAALTARGETLTAAARALGMSGSFLSQLKGGKPMGDDVARKIEKLRKLAHGWMDNPHGDDSVKLWPPSQSVRINAVTLAHAYTTLRDALALQGYIYRLEEKPQLLVWVYEYLTEADEDAPSNLLDFGKRLREKLQEQGAGKDEGSKTGGTNNGGV